MIDLLKKFNLAGKTAIITGGAGLLGKSFVSALLDAECTVIVFDIDIKNIASCKKYFAEQSKKNQVLFIKIDITNENEVKKGLRNIKKILKRIPNILINNASINPKIDKKFNGRLEVFDIKRWNNEISVGLTGALICTKIFGAEMAKNKSGVIINIASDLGIIAPNQTIYKIANKNQQNVKPVSYSVVKHGLIGLTRYTSTYWAKDGIRCNALAPGGVYTNQPSAFVNQLKKLIPLNRMAHVDEYQATLIYLCSDASSYMNGAVISVDGGRTAW